MQFSYLTPETQQLPVLEELVPVPEEAEAVYMAQELVWRHMVRVPAKEEQALQSMSANRASRSGPALVRHQFARWTGWALTQAARARDKGLLEMALEELALDRPRFGSLAGRLFHEVRTNVLGVVRVLVRVLILPVGFRT